MNVQIYRRQYCCVPESIYVLVPSLPDVPLHGYINSPVDWTVILTQLGTLMTYR